MVKRKPSGLLNQIDTSEDSFIMQHTSLQAPFAQLFLWTFLPVVAALLVGGLIDSTFTKMQNGRLSRAWCGLYFALQLVLNIFIILLVGRWALPFLPWLQLTISGIVAAVVYFAVQQQMVDNALCLVEF